MIEYISNNSLYYILYHYKINLIDLSIIALSMHLE